MLNPLDQMVLGGWCWGWDGLHTRRTANDTSFHDTSFVCFLFSPFAVGFC